MTTGSGSRPCEDRAAVKDPEARRIAELFLGSLTTQTCHLNAAHYKRLRFQLGQKEQFIDGFHLSGGYLPFMEEIFINRGLPFELTRLPFVESSFNTRARSKVGASGIWQFMKTTGGDFMMINDAIDLANDPLGATEVAAALPDQLRYARKLAARGDRLQLLGRRVFSARRIESGRGVSRTWILEKTGSAGFGFASANFFACLFWRRSRLNRILKKYFGGTD